MNTKIASIFLFLCLFFSACFWNEPAFFEDNKQLSEKGWQYEDIVSFEVPIDDTEKLYNIYLNLRHTDKFEFANAWVFVKTIFPDGTSKEAPVSLPLADDSGKWYGTGGGDIISTEILIQEYAQLPQKGTYTFEISQHMRVNPLNDILDLGLVMKMVDIPE